MTTGRGNFDRHGRPQPVQGDLTELRNRLEQTVQFGTVEEVDHEKTLARVRFSEGRVSNWITWTSGNADSGNGNSQPLQVGAQVAVLAPSGNAEQGFIIPGVYRESHERYDKSGDVYGNKYEDGTIIQFNKKEKRYDINIPSGTAHVSVGGASITITDGAIVMNVGGTVFSFTAGGFEQTGGMQTHDGLNVGSTHVHGGILPGGSDTAGPH